MNYMHLFTLFQCEGFILPLSGQFYEKIAKNCINTDSLSYTTVFKANLLIRESKHLEVSMIRIIPLKFGGGSRMMNIE